MYYFLTLYILMSIATFVAYGVDKKRAERGKWRIPESQLQTMAFLFGFPGALFGRRFFKHKLHKTGFTFILYAIAFLHVIAWTLYSMDSSV